MSGTTLSGIAALNPEIYTPIMRATYYSNNFPYEHWGVSTPPKGDYVYWRLATDGTQSGEATTEGASAPTANVASVIQMKIAKQSFQVQAQITHEAVDFADTSMGDPWALAIKHATDDLKDTASTTMLTALEAAISATGSYGGQTRTSYTSALVSGADSTSEALSISDMSTALRTVTDADRAVPMDQLAWYMSPTLGMTYAKISNQNVDTIRSITRAQGAPVDGGYGYGFSGMNFNGVPIFLVPDMTSTTALLGPRNDVKVWEAVPPRIKPLGDTDRSYKALIDTTVNITVTQPALWYKLTNKT